MRQAPKRRHDGWRRVATGGEGGAEPFARSPAARAVRAGESAVIATRLYPPPGGDWFVEFLGVPERAGEPGKRWSRISLANGDYGLPSFPFIGVATHDALATPWGRSRW